MLRLTKPQHPVGAAWFVTMRANTRVRPYINGDTIEWNRKSTNENLYACNIYDYSQAGFYFVTICCQNKQCLSGKVIEDQVELNRAGQMIQNWYSKLESKFPTIKCHDMIVMPNHFHCILEITDRLGGHMGPPLPRVVQWFKTMTTNEYIRGVKLSGWLAFEKKLWQRNYYEHVIRNEESYLALAEYIQSNPIKWQEDKYYSPTP